MSLGRDTGTAGDRVASPESGHLASPPWLYQRMVAPFSFTGGSHQHTKYQTAVHQWPSLTKELTTCFALSERSEKIKSGTLVEKIKVWRPVFLSLFKLKRSANVTSMWTLQISIETLVCRWMDGWDNPTAGHYKGKGLCMNSMWDWQYQDTRARGTGTQRFSAPQSNNQKVAPEKVTSFTSVRFVCRAVVNAFSACSFQIWPPTSLNLCTVPSALSAIEDCSSSDVC